MRTIAIVATIGAGIALFATGIFGNAHDMSIGGTSIDRSIACGSFNAVYPIGQAPRSIQKQAITERLGRIVELMGERESHGRSVELRAAREANLARLLAYRDRGQFPVNTEGDTVITTRTTLRRTQGKFRPFFPPRVAIDSVSIETSVPSSSNTPVIGRARGRR